MSGLKGGIAGLALAAAVAGAQAEEPKVTPVGPEAVAATTKAATQRLMVAVETPILLAQASAPPESDGKEYFADVVQVDGTKKRIKYYRYKNGSILPPPVEDGKLVDGSPAPSHAIRALNAQVKILVPYDKNAQTALAMVGDKDLIADAINYSKGFRELIDTGKPVTKEQVETLLFHSYIMIESGRNFDGGIKTAQLVATGRLKMTNSQFEEMRSSAEQKAKKIWKNTTGAVA